MLVVGRRAPDERKQRLLAKLAALNLNLLMRAVGGPPPDVFGAQRQVASTATGTGSAGLAPRLNPGVPFRVSGGLCSARFRLVGRRAVS